MAPKNQPSAELKEKARTILSKAINNDAIKAEGPFHYAMDVLEPGYKQIWSPLPNTLRWTWSKKGKCFAFSMSSTEVQVDSYWMENMSEGFVAHHGQERHIATMMVMSSYSPWFKA